MRKGLKNFFIPYVGNNHRPKSLNKKSVFSIVGIAILVESFFILSLFFGIPGQRGFLASILPSALVADANAERAELSVNELKVSSLLQEAAQLKANDMAEKGYFSHTTPSGESPWVFLDKVGYVYEAAGENLAVDFNDSYATHNAWMNSPTHRANIIQSKFTEIGIATAEGVYNGHSAIYVVQFFGRPKISSLPVSHKIEDETSILSKDNSDDLKVSVKGENIEIAPVQEMALINNSVDSINTNSKYGRINIPWKIVSSPWRMSGLILLSLFAFALLALALNVFIRIKIQHKDLLRRGVTVLALLALFSFVNYQIIGLFGVIA